MRLGYLMKYGLSRKSVFACSAKKKEKKKAPVYFLFLSYHI